ncbi:MAG: hypothetical protein EXR27_18755 [Betaproteobacteria bacterium]|nr:hypothetical protein [Betaproteobacteria bacterium]
MSPPNAVAADDLLLGHAPPEDKARVASDPSSWRKLISPGRAAAGSLLKKHPAVADDDQVEKVSLLYTFKPFIAASAVIATGGILVAAIYSP